jgi:hypothetical protein
MDPYIGLLSKNKVALYNSIKDISASEIIRNLLILDEKSRSLEYRELIYSTIRSKTDNQYDLCLSCYLLNLPKHLKDINNIDYKMEIMSLWRNGEL